MAMTRAHRTREHSHPVSPSRPHGQPETVGPEAEPLTQRQANLFHLLAHPARLALLDALRYESACVCHLEALLGYPQAYISQQLAVLRSAGLIEGRREGWNVYYHVCDARLFAVLDAALDLLSLTASASLARPVKQEHGGRVPGCACPRCLTATTSSAAAVASGDTCSVFVDERESL